MKRSTYSDVTEMKVRFGKLELCFLRWLAREHGIALSEAIRRGISEMAARYEQQGKYQPERDPSVAKHTLSISVERSADGLLWYRYLKTFSPDLTQAVVSVLNRHV